jgi:hypothetical protein
MISPIWGRGRSIYTGGTETMSDSDMVVCTAKNPTNRSRLRENATYCIIVIDSILPQNVKKSNNFFSLAVGAIPET